MKKKAKKTYAERCDELLDSSIRGARRLLGLGRLSDALGDVIEGALERLVSVAHERKLDTIGR